MMIINSFDSVRRCCSRDLHQLIIKNGADLLIIKLSCVERKCLDVNTRKCNVCDFCDDSEQGFKFNGRASDLASKSTIMKQKIQQKILSFKECCFGFVFVQYFLGLNKIYIFYIWCPWIIDIAQVKISFEKKNVIPYFTGSRCCLLWVLIQFAVSDRRVGWVTWQTIGS